MAFGSFKNFFPISFRARLAISYTIVLGLLLTVAAVTFTITLRQYAERRLDAVLWVLGASEAESITSRLRDRSLRDPDELAVHDVDYHHLSGYSEFGAERYVTIVDSTGHVADHSLNLSDRPLPIDSALIRRSLSGEVCFTTDEVAAIGAVRTIYFPVNNQDTDSFVVVVGVPVNFIGSTVRRLVLSLVLIIIFVLLLAGVGGWLLARRALRPVEEATDAVRKITDRNLHERLPEMDADDELGRLVKTFNQLLARLDLAFDSQRRFTADASHEIATPLTILKGNTQVALLQRRTPEEYEELLTSNLEEIDRLASLTRDLLVLARSDSGQNQLDLEPIVLNELIESICRQIGPSASVRGVTVRIDAKRQVIVEADEASVRQIILNLVHNAVRYSNDSGEVLIELKPTENNTVRICVTDNGIGVSAESVPYIFERFYRASGARAYDPTGSGLGLAICRVLAAAHGGTIELIEVSGATRFELTLPRVLDNE